MQTYLETEAVLQLGKGLWRSLPLNIPQVPSLGTSCCYSYSQGIHKPVPVPADLSWPGLKPLNQIRREDANKTLNRQENVTTTLWPPALPRSRKNPQSPFAISDLPTPRRPQPRCSQGPQVPGREAGCECRARPGRPGGCAPRAPRSRLALTLAGGHVCGTSGRLPRGWRREPAGKAAGRAAGRAAGPRGAPGAGALLPTRLGHSAAQAVAPGRAASCGAAPRLGVTISQSRRTASPSSTAGISSEGWERHRRARLGNTDTGFSQRKRAPQRVKCNTDGKQGGPHWKMLLGQGCAASPVQQHHLLGARLPARPRASPRQDLPRLSSSIRVFRLFSDTINIFAIVSFHILLLVSHEVSQMDE